MSKHYRTETDCLNCGAKVTGKFCSECGQENIVPKEKFSHIISHFFSDYLHLDSKFFGSIKPLLFKPGFLAVKYNEGKRQSYIHPFRLYIFISIIFFILIGKIDDLMDIRTTGKVHDVLRFQSTGTDSLSIDTVGHLKKRNSFDFTINEGDANDTTRKADSTIEAYEKRQASLAEDERDNFMQRFANKKAITYAKNKEESAKKMQEDFAHNIPKMVFMLMPLFALLLNLIFYTKHKYYVEHFYFAVNLHSFFFLFLLLANLIALISPLVLVPYIDIASGIYLVWYILKALHTVYVQAYWLLVLKFLFLVISYTILLLGAAYANAMISFLLA